MLGEFLLGAGDGAEIKAPSKMIARLDVVP